MSSDQQHASKNNRNHPHKPASAWKRLHRDWKAWVIVGLMLAAMAAYVLSDDESLQPGGGPPSEPMPAAAGM